MRRRAFLGLLAGLPYLSTAYAESRKISENRDRYLLIPGYQVAKALKRGVVKADADYHEQTLVSRLDLHSGRIERRIMPLKGHEICLHPYRQSAFFACQSRRQMLSFNLQSLEIEQYCQTYGKDFVGGGHAIYTPDGNYLITTERRISGQYQGNKKSHYGQVTIRDADSLKVLQVYNSQGILPHELQFIHAGKHIAIAHYGSITGQQSVVKEENSIQTIEPSITILDVASGQLLDKYIAPVNDYEIRHLTIRQHDLANTKNNKKIPNKVKDNQSHNDLVIAITNRLQRSGKKQTHFPAPAFNWQPGKNNTDSQPEHFVNNIQLHRSQSVVYEPNYDEAIVSVTEANQIAVLDASNGGLKKTIDCQRFNLHRPRGLTLLNHPEFYAVAGSFHGVVIIQRGTHRPVKYFDTPLYQHSHITIA